MLAINGGAQLLLSGAFAQTGAVAGTVFMVRCCSVLRAASRIYIESMMLLSQIITAFANCWTSHKLCWQVRLCPSTMYSMQPSRLAIQGWPERLVSRRTTLGR